MKGLKVGKRIIKLIKFKKIMNTKIKMLSKVGLLSVCLVTGALLLTGNASANTYRNF